MAKNSSQLSRIISIPDYWKDHVNSDIDLRAYPKQPCPFHHEEHGKSLSYKEGDEYFSCFGKCHVLHGDVVRMHMLNYHISDYAKAEEGLARMYGITLSAKELTFEFPKTHVNMADVEERVAIAKAVEVCNTVEDWLELDMIMSQYPPQVDLLTMFINRRKL